MNNDILLKNIKLENLPALMAYISPDKDGISDLSKAIGDLRRELPNVVSKGWLCEELYVSIYVIAATITELNKIHQELIERIPSYPEPAYW